MLCRSRISSEESNLWFGDDILSCVAVENGDASLGE